MAFSYAYDLAAGGVDRVRWELSDTDSEAYFLEDEEIEAVLALNADLEGDAVWQQTVLQCLRNIIMKLNRPEFKADWLTVKPEAAVKQFRALLADKEAEYGVQVNGSFWFTTSAVNVKREDTPPPVGTLEDWTDYDGDGIPGE